MRTEPESVHQDHDARSGVPTFRIKKVVHRVNNFASVILTESELALLLGNDGNRAKALQKVVSVVEEMKRFLNGFQEELARSEALEAGIEMPSKKTEANHKSGVEIDR